MYCKKEVIKEQRQKRSPMGKGVWEERGIGRVFFDSHRMLHVSTHADYFFAFLRMWKVFLLFPTFE